VVRTTEIGMHPTRQRLASDPQTRAPRNAAEEVRQVWRFTFERPVLQVGQRIARGLTDVEDRDRAKPDNAERRTRPLVALDLSGLHAARSQDSDTTLAALYVTAKRFPGPESADPGCVRSLRCDQTQIVEGVGREQGSGSQP